MRADRPVPRGDRHHGQPHGGAGGARPGPAGGGLPRPDGLGPRGGGMGREPRHPRGDPRRGGGRRPHHRQHALPRGARPRHPPRPAGPPRQLRRDRRLHGGERGGDADPARRPRHGQARHRRDGPHQAAARRAHPGGGQRQVADGDAAPPAAHPALPPRQGAGPARLVPDHAVLAGRLGRQRRGDGALPRLALRRPQRLARRRRGRTGRVPRGRPLPPPPCRAHRDPRRRPARTRRAEGDGRPPRSCAPTCSPATPPTTTR